MSQDIGPGDWVVVVDASAGKYSGNPFPVPEGSRVQVDRLSTRGRAFPHLSIVGQDPFQFWAISRFVKRDRGADLMETLMKDIPADAFEGPVRKEKIRA